MKPNVVICALLLDFISCVSGKSAAHRILRDRSELTPRSRGKSGIVGGTNAGVGEFPHQVALLWGGAEFGIFYCGGSLIQKDWVVSAAHCCAGDEESPENIAVVVGSHHLHVVDNSQETIPAIRVITHEDYDGFTLENDICLIKLEHQITEESSTVKQIGLPNSNQEYTETDGLFTVSGWGATSEGGSLATVLQKVTVPFVNDDYCNTLYNGEIAASMLCAGEAGHDSCQGDSGGPLMNKEEDDDGVEQLRLAGIVSWGEGCARPGKPGVYTQTSYFREWIDYTIRNND